MIIRVNPQGPGNNGTPLNKPKAPKKKKTLSPQQMIITNILITLLFALVYYYVRLPALNLKNPSFYGFFFIVSLCYCLIAIARKFGLSTLQNAADILRTVKDCCMVPAIICGGLALLYVLGSFLSSPIIRAKAYSQLLVTEESSFAEDIDEISFDQIPMLDATSANALATRKLGELSDLVSQFEVNSESYQINYKDHPVRVTYLNYGDIFKWLRNTGSGIPAYMIVDMVSQEVSVIRQNDGIRYSPSEHFFRYLHRHLRFQYPTLMFSDVNFEIDDDGNPWWVASVVTKRIGLFGGEDVIGAVLLNAESGASQYYKVEEIPTWVDRVYSADLIVQQYDYYGRYLNGYINSLFTQAGCTATTTGYNYIAQDDDVWVYTGITSVGGDESNIGFILVNQRTKEAKYYSIAGAEEYSAMSSAEGAVQQYSYNATFPLLLNIEGQPTYFMALKDNSNLVKMYAMVNVHQYQIVATGASVAECQQSYLRQLVNNSLVDNDVSMPTTLVDTVTVTGTVAEIRSSVADGWTHFLLRLTGSDTWYDISAENSLLPAILENGDRITLETAGTDSEIVAAYSVERVG